MCFMLALSDLLVSTHWLVSSNVLLVCGMCHWNYAFPLIERCLWREVRFGLLLLYGLDNKTAEQECFLFSLGDFVRKEP